MPRNTGTMPDTGEGLIDLRFRGGHVRRETTADKWRWKPWEWGESEFDVVVWQHSGSLEQQKEKAA